MSSTKYPFLTIERGSIDEAALGEVESSVGFPLPRDFRDFLRQANGGWSDWQLPVPGFQGEFTPWCHFFGVQTRCLWEDLLSRHHHSGQVLEDESLRFIADVVYGFLALRPDDPRVYYVDGSSNERRDDCQVLRAADFEESFEALCAKLRPPKRSPFYPPLLGRADPHPLRKLLQQALNEEDLRSAASVDYGQSVEENLTDMRALLDLGPGHVSYSGGNVWECWLLGEFSKETEKCHGDLIRLFSTFALLGEVALCDWTYVSNAQTAGLVEGFASAVRSQGKTWHRPGAEFLRWSASIAPPFEDKLPWREAIRSLEF